jgi:hypothetical protein
MRKRYALGTLKKQSAPNQPYRQKNKLKIGNLICKIGNRTAAAAGGGKGKAKLTNGR